jgi:hypothetical protein
MLEFFRRASTAEPEEAPSPGFEPTTRMLVLRRSQAIVAGVAAVAALLLAFLLGMMAGGGDDAANAAPQVYVIRAVAYGDDDQGRAYAQSVREQLERMDLGQEVGIYRVPSESRTVVTVGSWLVNPAERKEARALRDRLRGIKDERTRETPFASAEFWPMRR